MQEESIDSFSISTASFSQFDLRYVSLHFKAGHKMVVDLLFLKLNCTLKYGSEKSEIML